MTTDRIEFSRPVPLTRLGTEPFRQEIAADERERDALARRFDLVSLDRLMAEVTLEREAGGTIVLRATFEAAFVQECVVTLDPIGGAVAAGFALRYGPLESEPTDPDPNDEVAFEPLAGAAIDIGEAVAQEFSLALPAFPRSPDAPVEPGDDAEPPDGPLQKLLRSVEPKRS